jgi:MSHA biogenesis protein MshQ
MAAPGGTLPTPGLTPHLRPGAIARTYKWLAIVMLWLLPAMAQAQISFVSASAPSPSSNAVSSVTVARPAGLLSGDVMIAVVSFNDVPPLWVLVCLLSPSSCPVAPTGWTLVATPVDGTRMVTQVYQRVATGTEPASYTWTLGGPVGTVGNSRRAAGAILAYRGVDTTAPVEANASQNNAASTTATAPSVTTVSANAMLVSVFSVVNGSTTATPPASMTNAFNVTTTSGPNGLRLLASYASQPVAGASGVRTATLDTARTSIGVSLALRPAPIPPPTSGSFNAFETTTSAGAVSGVIQTKVVDTPFSLAIVALNTARTAINTAYTGSATVQVLDASDNSGAADANGCRSTWQAITGAGSTVTFNSGNAGRVTTTLGATLASRELRIRVVDGGGRIGCSNDAFAVRPAALSISALDVDWQTAYGGDPSAATPRTLSNTAAAGGAVHGAGHPFTLQAVALNAAGTAISGYNGSPTVRSGSPACVLPSGGCTTGTLTFGTWNTVSGARVAADAQYSEAGTFTLLLEDTTFASIDAADTDAAGRTIAQSGGAITVGRFVPAYYDLQPSGTAPLLRTMNTTDASCSAAPTGTPRRSFTHVGQPFGFSTLPQATILARSTSGSLVTNYRGALWKIGPSQIGRTIDASATTPAGQASTVTVGTLVAGDVVSNGNGSGTVTGSALDAITYVRSTSTPASPFTAAIRADMRVLDNTEAGVTGNPALIPTTGVACFNGGGTCAAPATGIAFDSAVAGFPGNEFRYGRLRLVNANGSELLPLPAPALAEYWNGSAWVVNTRDFCTTVDTARVALSNWQRNLQTGETSVTSAGTMQAGRRSIVLRAPGAGNSGSVDLSIDLAAAGLPWLQGAWTGSAYTQNPSARATFGTASQPAPIIFRRERY